MCYKVLSSLPYDNGQLNTVQQLARIEPNRLTNLTELQGIITQNKNINLYQDSRQQHVSEWIEALENTIETILNGDLQKYFRDLFLVESTESTITFKCDQNHQSQIRADT